ncbi:hypothetical protein L596_023786 [Steinernema carpocapsae]|uniref:Uncharacterized protein n=1 Tax=Steinernema carpocapsae TaxID=34508 RepID=A0A4U5MER6_STECR|nr:hypothetical protein L596_023786 [Steinernema carpocapsae]
MSTKPKVGSMPREVAEDLRLFLIRLLRSDTVSLRRRRREDKTRENNSSNQSSEKWFDSAGREDCAASCERFARWGPFGARKGSRRSIRGNRGIVWRFESKKRKRTSWTDRKRRVCAFSVNTNLGPSRRVQVEASSL